LTVIFGELNPPLPHPHNKKITPSAIWTQERLYRIYRSLDLVSETDD
jgi:hypothetical protein